MIIARRFNKEYYEAEHKGFRSLADGRLVRIPFRRSSLKLMNRHDNLLEDWGRRGSHPSKRVSVLTDVHRAVRLVLHVRESEMKKLVETLDLSNRARKVYDLLSVARKTRRYSDVERAVGEIVRLLGEHDFQSRRAKRKAEELLSKIRAMPLAANGFELNKLVMPAFFQVWALENRINLRLDEIRAILDYNEEREDVLRAERDAYIRSVVMNLVSALTRGERTFKFRVRNAYFRDIENAERLRDGYEKGVMPVLKGNLGGAGRYVRLASKDWGYLRTAAQYLLANKMGYIGEELRKTDGLFYSADADLLVKAEALLKDMKFRDLIGLLKGFDI